MYCSRRRYLCARPSHKQRRSNRHQYHYSSSWFIDQDGEYREKHHKTPKIHHRFCRNRWHRPIRHLVHYEYVIGGDWYGGIFVFLFVFTLKYNSGPTCVQPLSSGENLTPGMDVTIAINLSVWISYASFFWTPLWARHGDIIKGKCIDAYLINNLHNWWDNKLLNTYIL